MTRDEVAECYAMVTLCYRIEPAPGAVKVWHLLLKDLDGPAAVEATRRLCLRDTSFPPVPGQIIAEVERRAGKTPPSIEAATGYFESGHWDIHPFVSAAAGRVYWDRNAAPDQARWQFRSFYQAQLDLHGREPMEDVLALDGPVNPLGELE